MIDLKPTILLIDTPHDERIPEPRPRTRSASPHSRSPLVENEINTPEEEVYGLALLQRVITEVHMRNMAKLVVPVPLISVSLAHDAPADLAIPTDLIPSPALLKRCVDLGAADVIAYKAHKEAAKEQQAMLELRRGRKLSWVGMHEEKPFAYLREAMVSDLMKGICRLGWDADDLIGSAKISVSHERRASITAAVGCWHFPAHDFADDELLLAAMLMFKHAFSIPELEKWRIPTDQLIGFLIACRGAYNPFVPYHNFRHVPKSPMANLISPFDGLTLLITAIGHDVGHPGVNNNFLITLNAPLAQLYNDRSVLESFHCAAFSQILRRYWPVAFEEIKMRKLIISSILATDMGLHFDYMKKLADAQTTPDAVLSDERVAEEQRSLACALLIKCADISNVARHYDTAKQWMHILSDEFSRQASMESELGVVDLMPALKYTVDELQINRALFESGAVAAPVNGDGASAANHTTNGFASSVSTTESSLGDGPAPSDSDVDGSDAPRGGPDVAAEELQKINGVVTTFDSVADFATSDPFNMRYRLDSFGDARGLASAKQRYSEATNGSNCPSQATSATTGKMPLSPSTQGTSIASRDSMDRSMSVPRPVSSVAYDPSCLGTCNSSKLETPILVTPDSDLPPEVLVTESSRDDDSGSNGSMGKPENTTLRKRPILLELPEQLVVITSSSKKRKVTRNSARDRDAEQSPSPQAASAESILPSCESNDEDDQAAFSFSVASQSSFSTTTHPQDSISSLPSRLQTRHSSLVSAGYPSSTASSPCAAYADLSLEGEPSSATTETGPALHPASARSRSPIRYTRRGIMSGNGDSIRSSSPLKRRASSMDPEPNESGGQPPTDFSRAMSVDAPDSGPGYAQNPDAMPPLPEQLKTIQTLQRAFNETPVQENDVAFVVTKTWVSKALAAGGDPKYAKESSSDEPLGPVDNSNIIQEVIELPSGDHFVRLKPGTDLETSELFSEDAWSLIQKWYGLKDGQYPIRRVALNTQADASSPPNIIYEMHPRLYHLSAVV
ncbi:unnamed protein product [Parascedosporium putredinis]|uniref:Phosphodiesterase n=1 Tax=Parascedosporium putredinis TaxID=1442378 RepID=A0A9P1HBD9_9PEZI|nr:unnamed protein product [Parascedosporium putredinis]CAI8003855.1 unnamed protein product [Parascedosporium putredinis]